MHVSVNPRSPCVRTKESTNMSSRQIQIVVGLLIIATIGIGLVMFAERNRKIIAERMDTVTIAGVETKEQQERVKAEDEAATDQAAELTAESTQQTPQENQQETATGPQPVPPSFDVARFEAAGDGVIAGLAVPGALVELLANDVPIATATAGDTGEWVIVLEKLAPGNHDLSLRSTKDDGEQALSEEFIAVVIPEKPTGEVLVVASKPGQASEILARPAGDDQSPAAADAAKADDDAPAMAGQTAGQPEGASETDGLKVAKAAEKPGDQPLAEQVDESEVTGAPADQKVAAAETTEPVEDAEVSAAGVGSTDETVTSEGAVARTDTQPTGNIQLPDSTSATSDEPRSDTLATAETARPGASEDMAAKAQPKQSETGSGDTAEVAESATPAKETDDIKVAAKPRDQDRQGASTPPAADDEAGAAMAPSADSDGIDVQALEEVNKAAKQDRLPESKPEFDASDDKPQLAMDASEQKTGISDADVAGADQNEQPASPKPEQPKADVTLALDAVETEGEMVYAAGTGNPGSRVRVYVDNSLIGEATANDDGRWLLETPAEIPAGDVVVRADELKSNSSDVSRRAEVPFVKEVDAVALLPSSATAGGGASKSAKQGKIAGPKSVIIRSGDNLWTISRRVYGRGIRYTTIYRANDDQIRSPHRIYPGQVFVIPEAEEGWVQQ